MTEDDVDATVKHAIEARKAGDWEAAFEIMRSGLARHPDNLRLMVLLGVAYQARYRYGDAIEVLRRAAQLAPEHFDVLYQLGYALRSDGDAWAASAVHRHLLEHYPDRSDARYADATTQVVLGRPEAAAGELERLMRASPTELKYRVGHARLLVRMGRFTAALEVLRALLDAQPEVVDAWLLRAEAAKGLLRTEEQNASARRAFELLPDAPLTLYWMHVVAFVEADPRKAHDYLQQAITIHPRCLPAHVALGSLYWMADDLDLAGRAFATADRIGASWNGVAQGMWAQFQIATGRGQPNLEALEAEALTIPYGGLPYHLGRTYLVHLDDPARAVRFLRLACDCAPDAVETHELCGNALVATGTFDEAAAKFRRAVELCPNLGSSWEGLGFALWSQRDLAGAEAAYAQATERSPRSASARRGYGATLLERDDITGAIAQLEAAIELEPDAGRAHYLLARALETAGRREDALAAGFRARGRMPDDADVAALLKRLQPE